MVLLLSVPFFILQDIEISCSSFSYFFDQGPIHSCKVFFPTCLQSLVFSMFLFLSLPPPPSPLNIHQALTLHLFNLESSLQSYIKPPPGFSQWTFISQSIPQLGDLTHILAITITSFLPWTPLSGGHNVAFSLRIGVTQFWASAAHC